MPASVLWLAPVPNPLMPATLQHGLDLCHTCYASTPPSPWTLKKSIYNKTERMFVPPTTLHLCRLLNRPLPEFSPYMAPSTVTKWDVLPLRSAAEHKTELFLWLQFLRNNFRISEITECRGASTLFLKNSLVFYQSWPEPLPSNFGQLIPITTQRVHAKGHPKRTE